MNKKGCVSDTTLLALGLSIIPTVGPQSLEPTMDSAFFPAQKID